MILDIVLLVSTTGHVSAGKGVNIDTLDEESSLFKEEDVAEVYKLLEEVYKLLVTVSIKGIGGCDSVEDVTVTEDGDDSDVHKRSSSEITPLEEFSIGSISTKYNLILACLHPPRSPTRKAVCRSSGNNQARRLPGLHPEYSTTASGRGSNGGAYPDDRTIYQWIRIPVKGPLDESNPHYPEAVTGLCRYPLQYYPTSEWMDRRTNDIFVMVSVVFVVVASSVSDDFLIAASSGYDDF
ncbi:hypothetical protein TNCV_2008901 [Trichonephila clavipes]|nr:hypothetical protein TNCV_2008901 [Trichonephila clavipes]